MDSKPGEKPPLKIDIKVEEDKKTLGILFSAPVRYIGFNKEEAIRFARAIAEKLPLLKK